MNVHSFYEVLAVEEIRLTEVTLNEQVMVSSVGSEETEFLKYLSDIGLKPNVVVKVSEAAPTGGTLSIDIVAGQESRRQVIGTQLAEKILVSEAT